MSQSVYKEKNQYPEDELREITWCAVTAISIQELHTTLTRSPGVQHVTAVGIHFQQLH